VCEIPQILRGSALYIRNAPLQEKIGDKTTILLTKKGAEIIKSFPKPAFLGKNTGFEHLWGLSSAGRAPDLHSGGQEFDPPRLHQT